MNANQVIPENLFVVRWFLEIYIHKLMSSATNHSRASRSGVIGHSIELNVYRCEFFTVKTQQPNNSGMTVCIHYHICKISAHIIKCKILHPWNDFLQETLYNTIFSMM